MYMVAWRLDIFTPNPLLQHINSSLAEAAYFKVIHHFKRFRDGYTLVISTVVPLLLWNYE